MIDFTKLPVEELILIMRRIGLRLLEELLIEPLEPGKPLPETPPPQLLKFLSKQECQTLATSKIWKYRYSWGTGSIPGDIKEKLSKSMKRLTQKSLKGKLKGKKWETGFSNRLAIALGGAEGDIIPDDLWPVITKAAWLEPAIQFTAASKIFEWLRRESLFASFEFPNIRLAPNTFWFLIALTTKKPLRLRSWFSKKERAGARVEKKLKEQARTSIIINEWANEWDRWVIKMAIQRWTPGFYLLDEKLRQSLLELPILKNIEIPGNYRKKSKSFLPTFFQKSRRS